MIQDLANGGIIVTAAPDNGSTSFVQMLSNIICSNNGLVLYYNPSRTINREFIKSLYPEMYKNVCFMTSSVDIFIEYINTIDSSIFYDYIIIDPGDIIAINSQLVLLKRLLDLYNCTMICTSQIREDLSEGGKVYSTLDRLNKKYCNYGSPVFQYSIWIRNVSEPVLITENKYIEVYNHYRDKKNFIDRNIAIYSKEGRILNEKDYNSWKLTKDITSIS